MPRWDHGGNIYEASQFAGCAPEEIIDLSASINPLGPPEGLKELLLKQFGKIAHYPDIRNRNLIEAISSFHDIHEDYIAVGNGSTEILYWLPYALSLERVAVVIPTFSEYLRTLQNKGVIIRFLSTSWENSFQPTVHQIEALIESGSPEAVFLTNPGSPSGIPLSEDVKEFIRSNLGKFNLIWIIDEVFADFCEEYSLIELAKSSQKVIIIRSLTKFYTLPGIRLGYVLAHPSLSHKIRSFIPPWSVNAFAQEAGVYCLGQHLFREKTLEFFKEERPRVFDLLEKIPYVNFLKSVANYVLIKLENGLPYTASDIQSMMLRNHKILVRNCENFKGLSGKFIRIAISSRETNDLWLGVLRTICDSY